jgi:glutathione S-transferase
MADEPYKIYGALGSPYSMKMRAIFRYRHIPHIWIQRTPKFEAVSKEVKVPVIPIIKYPDGTYHNDSTPILFDLEERHKNGRSIVPDDEAMAFLAYLLEDMADEWATKMMFHYRWFRPRDQKQMSEWLAFDSLPGEGRETQLGAAKFFAERQIGRMAIVGCTEHNQALIEKTATMAMAAFNSHVTEEAYLFGSRPSLADFSWFGQMSQLAVDPTPADLMRAEAPSFYRWIAQIDDASGIEGTWNDAAQPTPQAVHTLLGMAGEVYLPFLVANAKALDRADDTFHTSGYGLPYSQGAFKYQAKCLNELRSRFAALSAGAKERLEHDLKNSDCWNVLEN